MGDRMPRRYATYGDAVRFPVLVYLAARAALLAAVAGVGDLAGLRGPLLLLVAVLVSGLASLVLLNRQRDAVSVSVAERARRARERLDEGARGEDDD